MQCLIYLVVMALAFFGAVAFGVYANYRFMKRIAEGKSPNAGGGNDQHRD